MLNTYARVIGAVRQHGESKSIMIYKIHAVQGINEVNTHYLEVINARYQAEDYCNGGGGGSNLAVKMDTDAYSGTVKQELPSTQDGPQGISVVVFKAIQAGGVKNPDTGINRQELIRQFPRITPNEMQNIFDKLTSEGHIYSTIDNDHFLACF
jgi:replication factor A2